MGAGVAYAFKHITATAVIAGSAIGAGSTNSGGAQAVLHTVNISAAATATISIYDDNQTGSPVAGNLIQILTAPAGGLNTYYQYDAQCSRGIAIIIAVAAADVCVSYR